MKIYAYLLSFLTLIFAQQRSLKFDESFDPSTLKEPEVKLPIILSPSEPLPIKFSSTEIDTVVEGFRVQVLATKNLNKANTVLEALSLEFGSEVYIVFDSPNYKLRVGNYRSRVSAEKIRDKIVKLGYRAPWVIKTKVKRTSIINRP